MKHSFYCISLVLLIFFISCGTSKETAISKSQNNFISLFDGKTLDQWVGNKQDYLVKNGAIVITPEGGGRGNLYTKDEYENFIFRFSFKLTPGANNGLGIHAPLKGDAAYAGKELQILDNTAEKHKNLKPYQYHGSVYGVAPAKRGALKSVGEWNQQEVYVKNEFIRVTLNGQVILEGEHFIPGKTVDGRDHPGLAKTKGHIGFLGHGDEVHFKDISIRILE